jgi:hypothetical protein
MAMLGESFNARLTDFKEFKDAVNRLTDEVSAADKMAMMRKSKNVSSQSNISIDLYNRIYMKLQTGENVKVILYVDQQRSPDKYFMPDRIFAENLNRYHIYKCPAVDTLFSKGSKFSVTTRADGGFNYKFFNNGGELLHETNSQHLLICKQCLNEFNIRHNTNFANSEFHPSIYFNYEH